MRWQNCRLVFQCLSITADALPIYRMFYRQKKREIIFMDKITTQPFIGLLNPLFWRDKLIQYKSFSGCLGITIDDKLSWSNHIQSVTQSFSSKVKMLRPIGFLPRRIPEKIYY